MLNGGTVRNNATEKSSDRSALRFHVRLNIFCSRRVINACGEPREWDFQATGWKRCSRPIVNPGLNNWPALRRSSFKRRKIYPRLSVENAVLLFEKVAEHRAVIISFEKFFYLSICSLISSRLIVRALLQYNYRNLTNLCLTRRLRWINLKYNTKYISELPTRRKSIDDNF